MCHRRHSTDRYEITILQGSVATHLRYGEVVCSNFFADCISPPFCQSTTMGRDVKRGGFANNRISRHASHNCSARAGQRRRSTQGSAAAERLSVQITLMDIGQVSGDARLRLGSEAKGSRSRLLSRSRAPLPRSDFQSAFSLVTTIWGPSQKWGA